MDKAFFEVFPTLKLNKGLQELFEETAVTRVVSSSRKDQLKIYLSSPRLIEKETIYGVEREIVRQLFPEANIRVSFLESFHLSSQYTPKTLMDAYHDSIMLELKNYNHFDYQLFYHANLDFSEEKVIRLVLEDTIVARNRSGELVRVLDKILNERCGIGTDIRISYRDAAPNKAREHAKLKMQEEVGRITRLSENGEEEGQEEQGQESAGILEAGLQAPAAVLKPADNTEISAKRKDGKPAGGKKEWKSRASLEKGSSITRGGSRYKKSSNPDVVYGRDFEEEPVPIAEIAGEVGEVIVKGKIIRFETRDTRNEKKLVIFDITDYTDTITVKMFPRPEQQEELFANVEEGKFIIVKGVANIDKFDGELTLGFIVGIKKTKDFTSKRMDTEIEKRVELHCHTKMSDMDGVSDVGAIIKRAVKWGHPAIAITDHGVVQGFTDAFHTMQRLKSEYPDFKILYGMEGYLVDDMTELVVNPMERTLNDTFVIFDLETTGFSPIKNNIIEIGAVKVINGKIVDHFSAFVNPKEPIPFRIEKLTGINDAMVEDAPYLNEVLPKFLEFSKGAVFVAHNASFDMGFLIQKAKELGITDRYTYADTVGMARVLMPELSKYKLDHVAKALKISLENHHRAVDDAGATAEIFVRFAEMLEKKNIRTLKEINALADASVEKVKKAMSYHVILIAKNEVGRINLYKLVSLSHLKYYHQRPRIPKSVLNQYREGLIIGSACEAGELYQAVMNEKPEAEIARIISFYDYLEIQPLGNNEFMVREERYGDIHSDEDLIVINKKIIALGEQFHKPVVATCDTHFLDPEDEVYRRIIMAGKGFKDADEQGPLYLRTTEEMMKEFSYLPYDKAYEIVIKNTNLIADMVDYIEPVRPDKCAPIIENSDQTLRDICYRRAHEIYGTDLPAQVSERLEKELHSIITNGFAVMYIIAQKLVWKSMEDGYLVGSRGSVGSSFVATMAGITEVNPLSPHYYCSKCYYSDFTSADVRAYAGKAGCDMPDKLCPECGAPLNKEGFDIPFETFLGFKGDKEPDIDLNFSGEYQSKAHKYTEVIFGAGQTYRAGTIGTLADKTAYGYVKNYYEERGISKRPCEINRITLGCTGVRRTTGQHPGGIIVLPHGEEIDSFTPIQHPANDMTTEIVTTHFDYHSIDHNLLKLDILGHDDPTMIRRLQDLTQTDPQLVPLDDPKVMSLFKNTEALGIVPSDIGGCPLGSLGIPEFGTDFAMQMLIDTKPTSFSDLVRIAGLAHGTDVWLGNAQTLIQDGRATISTAICTRDDIMTYLIGMGVESSLSFTIMESVRKGKGLKGDWEKVMTTAGVPGWYLWSCNKIKYMFPKAHAAAYVMMAWRIAYYKVNYPLAYYSAFFSIRATGFSYEIMCQGKERLEYYLDDYKKRTESLTKKEQDVLRDMRIVQEMYARGFSFMPIDLFRAKAHECQIIDGKIMPHIGSIEGLGDKAADAVVEAALDGAFLSKDDFRERTKVSKTAIETMSSLGLLGELPESNQLSLFDFG